MLFPMLNVLNFTLVLAETCVSEVPIGLDILPYRQLRLFRYFLSALGMDPFVPIIADITFFLQSTLALFTRDVPKVMSNNFL